MVDAFYADNDEFQVIRADRVAFDARAKSLQLFPASKIVQTRNVVFPDLISILLYHRDTGGLGSRCESWSALMPQEWGPQYGNFSPGLTTYSPATRNLPAEAIGSVPAGTQFIDVRARLRRTQAPPAFFNNASPHTFFPNNEWISLQGGSCTCEMFFPLVRHFDVELSGTSVVLSRYQSVRNVAQWTDSTSGNFDGWVTQQDSMGAEMGAWDSAPVGYGYPTVLLDQKGPDGTGTKRVPWANQASNSCSVAANLNYQSTYSVDFEITPGRYS